MDTFVLIADQYDSEADALADYEAVRKLYTELNIIDTYDAAVITHTENGKVKIIKRVEEPTRHGAAKGLAIGFAVGAAIALFPVIGVGLGAGLLGGGAIGAGAGAVVGHVSGGMRRSDLKELGEMLDKGKTGLLVVAATDLEAKVNAVIKRAKKRAKAELQADTDMIKEEIDSLPKAA